MRAGPQGVERILLPVYPLFRRPRHNGVNNALLFSQAAPYFPFSLSQQWQGHQREIDEHRTAWPSVSVTQMSNNAAVWGVQTPLTARSAMRAGLVSGSLTAGSLLTCPHTNAAGSSNVSLISLCL